MVVIIIIIIVVIIIISIIILMWRGGGNDAGVRVSGGWDKNRKLRKRYTSSSTT